MLGARGFNIVVPWPRASDGDLHGPRTSVHAKRKDVGPVLRVEGDIRCRVDNTACH